MRAEIELEVSIVNLSYRFRGLDAIRELKAFCDEHASHVQDHMGGCEDDPRPDPPESAA